MVGRLAALLALLGLHGPLGAGTGDLLLEASLEPCRVQALCRYTLSFWQAVDATEPRFVPPAPTLAEIEADGPLRVREAGREGRPYRVVEQDYRLYPYASGPLTLAGAEVEARIPVPGGRQQQRLKAADLVAQVLPLPPIPPGQSWFPAESVSLAAEWLGDPARLEPGAPLKRRFRLEARGISAARLPALAPAGGDFSLYPGPEERSERHQGREIHATLTQTFTYVPRRAGELAVPPLALAWWHEGRGGWQWARVAEQRLRVEGASPALATTGGGVLAPGTPSPGWLVPAWLGAGALLAALLGVAWRGWYGALALSRAWAAGDRLLVRDRLLARTRGWPRPPANLQALAERLDDGELTAWLLALERACYGPPGVGLPDFPPVLRRRLGAAMRRLGRREKEPGGRGLH